MPVLVASHTWSVGVFTVQCYDDERRMDSISHYIPPCSFRPINSDGENLLSDRLLSYLK